MKTFNYNTTKIKNSDGTWSPIPALVGESAYQTAVRLGTFSGTEKEWNDYIKTEREKALEDIRKAGEDLTKSLPEDYVKMTEDVTSLKEDVDYLKRNCTGGSGTGSNGKDGVGILEVKQTTTSTEDGGTNIVTVTKTNGEKSTFQVRNGSKGSTGKTPNITIGTVNTL